MSVVSNLWGHNSISYHEGSHFGAFLHLGLYYISGYVGGPQLLESTVGNGSQQRRKTTWSALGAQ